MSTNSGLSRESFAPPEPAAAKAWIIPSLIALAILVTAVSLMKWAGLLDLPADAPGGQRIAAALALIGSLLTAVVTLIGTGLKYSIDDRTARLAKLEADRNHSLAIEADRRSRIDTVIRA